MGNSCISVTVFGLQTCCGCGPKTKSPGRISAPRLNSSACCNKWGCLLDLQRNALDDIAGGALDDGVLAEDLLAEILKLRAVHVLRHALGEALIALRHKKYVSVIIQRQSLTSGGDSEGYVTMDGSTRLQKPRIPRIFGAWRIACDRSLLLNAQLDAWRITRGR